MSAKDQISSGLMKGILEMLPTDYDPQNPVSQFLCDVVDNVLSKNTLANIIKAQAVKQANEDPNGVLERLVTVYNDRILVGFHNNIGDFVRELNEAEDAETGEEGFDRREIVKEINGDEDVKSP